MLAEMADYLSHCPELSGRQVCVNYLGEAAGSVSLELSDSRRGVKEYTDGGGMAGVTFTLSIRDSFGTLQSDNRKTSAVCRRIERWIEEQNLKGSLPQFKDNMSAVSVGIKRCFEIVRTQDHLARYSAEIELIYFN